MRDNRQTTYPAGQLNRRQLLTSGTAASALAWLGPTIGWSARAFAAGPPSKPTGQVVIGLSQEPTVFHPLLGRVDGFE